MSSFYGNSSGGVFFPLDASAIFYFAMRCGVQGFVPAALEAPYRPCVGSSVPNQIVNDIVSLETGGTSWAFRTAVSNEGSQELEPGRQPVSRGRE